MRPSSAFIQNQPLSYDKKCQETLEVAQRYVDELRETVAAADPAARATAAITYPAEIRNSFFQGTVLSRDDADTEHYRSTACFEW